MSYQDHIIQMSQLIESKKGPWSGIDAESVARMRLQNRFKTGLEIARYTADIMRKDMDAYDADSSKYTQSLGCWHGFIGQQKLISIKKHFGNTDRRYLYLSGWMVAALRSEFGPLPDQSMHEKTSVPALIEELYTFLRQADSRELNDIFRELDAARKAGDKTKEAALIDKIDNFQTHVVPVIADIKRAGAQWLYLLPDTFLGTIYDRVTPAALAQQLPTFGAAELAVRSGGALAGLVSRYYSVGQLAAATPDSSKPFQ